MAATIMRPVDPRHARAPPPTPIATGKGTRSAAVDDRILSEYLESSLRVPDLSLPESVLVARSPQRVPSVIDLPSLIAGDEPSVRRVLAAVAVVGAFQIDGRGVVSADEVQSAIEIGGAVFRIPEAKKRELGGRFGQREGIGEEFYWDRGISSETEAILEEIWSGNYPTFREKMENIACKLEMVAQCIQQILSKHAENQRDTTGIHRMRSILCLRKYESRHFGEDRSLCEDATYRHSRAITLHLYGDDHNFYIRCPEGSAAFGMPSGSILVTIGEQLQEWCSGGFKSACGEILPELIDAPDPLLSLELVCTSEPSVTTNDCD